MGLSIRYIFFIDLTPPMVQKALSSKKLSKTAPLPPQTPLIIIIIFFFYCFAIVNEKQLNKSFDLISKRERAREREEEEETLVILCFSVEFQKLYLLLYNYKN